MAAHPTDRRAGDRHHTPAQAAHAGAGHRRMPSPTGEADFGNSIGKASSTRSSRPARPRPTGMAQQAATGRLQNVEDYLITVQRGATRDMQLTVAVRNKAVEAFNEIMRMQV